MSRRTIIAAFIQGLLLSLGLAVHGYFVSNSLIQLKALERSVTVKGLAERDVPAGRATFSIQFRWPRTT